jgi:PAS domain S-box-containing protein
VLHSGQQGTNESYKVFFYKRNQINPLASSHYPPLGFNDKLRHFLFLNGWFWSALIALVLVALLIGSAAYQWLYHQAQMEAEFMLEGILDTQTHHFSQWQQMQQAKAQQIVTDPELQTLVQQTQQQPQAMTAALKKWLAPHFQNKGYHGLTIFDADHHVIASSYPPACMAQIITAYQPLLQQFWSAALPTKSLFSGIIQFDKLTDCADSAQLNKENITHISLVMAIPAAPSSEQQDPIGFCLFELDPKQDLYPRLYSGLMQKLQARGLLVDRETNRSYELQLTRPALSVFDTVRLVAFDSVIVQDHSVYATVFMLPMSDAWGRDAFALARHIPNSPWLLLITVPRAPWILPAQRSAVIIIVIILLVSGIIAALAALSIWHERSYDYLKRYQYEYTKRQLMKTVHQRDHQLQIFFTESITGMGIASPQLHWRRVNPALATMLGYTVEELLRLSWSEIVHDQDWFELQQCVQDVAHYRCTDYSRSWRLRCKDQTMIPVLFILHGVHDQAGVLTDFLVQIADLSDRVEIDQLYEILLYTSLEGFLLLDNTGQLLQTNVAYARMSGYSREALCAGMSVYDLEVLAHTSSLQAHYTGLLQGGSARFESQHRCKDGRIIDVEISTSYSLFKGGRSYVFVRDITARKQEEKIRAEEQQRLRALFDGLDAIIYVTDMETYQLLYANKTFENEYLTPTSQQTCYTTIHGFSEPCSFCTNERLLDDVHHGRYVWDWYHEKQQRWYRCADKLIPWVDHKPVRLQMALDITQQKMHDQQRIQLEKLGSLGLLSAGIAHELNNPLMGVINAIQFCIEINQAGTEQHSVLRDAEYQTRRCIAIVQNLLAFSRQGHSGTEFHYVQPEALFKPVMRLLDYLLRRYQITLHFDVDPEITELYVQRERFEQVIINLLTNAIDAVADCTTRVITIRCYRHLDAEMITITDTGSGIALVDQARIFEPFFTTKPAGQGTGLGLSTSWSIIADHGGQISVHSGLDGLGTTMMITLPRTRYSKDEK